MAFAAPPEKSAGNSAQGYLKNIARQHCSTTLSLYDAAAQRYVDTEAAAAWLDDDIATGWPALKGKQHYLVRLAEPQMLTNFELSTKIPSGTITIYTGVGDGTKAELLPEQKRTVDYREKAARMGGQMSVGGCSTTQNLSWGWWMRVTEDLEVRAIS